MREKLAAALRRTAHCLWANLLAASGCLWWAKLQMHRRGAVIVLTLHRVLDDASFSANEDLPGIVVRQRTFEKLAAYIAERYEAVDVGSTTPGESRKRLRVAFTFDDGWEDNYTFALAIAQKYGIPLTIFVCPGLTGLRAPFWPERVAVLLRAAGRLSEIEAVVDELKHCPAEERELWIERFGCGGATAALRDCDGTLSWEAILAMDRARVRFGSHTQTHQILTMVPADVARRELCDSKRAIEQALGHDCDLFAYPNGEWTPETRAMLAESGYRLAFTTKRGAWTASNDRLAIPRSNVYEDNLIGLTGRFSAAMFEYTTFWKAWRAMKGKAIEAPAGHRRVTAAV
jgi:peptidoglycan/xylan/chitin deacetylase (PgdA/CDA1 family)